MTNLDVTRSFLAYPPKPGEVRKTDDFTIGLPESIPVPTRNTLRNSMERALQAKIDAMKPEDFEH